MALHPRFKDYGLADEDADLVNSFRYAARRAGWSNERVDQAFAWFKEHGQAQMSTEARVQSFQEYTAGRGWSAGESEKALGWFNATAARLEIGQAPELPPAPSPLQDAARRAELEQLMRTDPQAYWRDASAQDELWEIAARASGQLAPTAGAQEPQESTRRSEIEAMMGTADYWKNPAIQAEYRSLVGGGGSDPVGEAGVAASPAGPAVTGDAT